jgi:hypothetical protein
MLAKMILISVLIAMIAVPLVASQAKSSQRGLRWTVFGILIFNIFYLIAIRYIYPRLQ